MNAPAERVELVQIPSTAKGEPYTTSETIAQGTGITHRKIRDVIRKYQPQFETFGRVASYQATLA